MSAPRALGLVLAAVLAGGCTEAYRWSDSPSRRPPPRVEVPEGYHLIEQGDTVYSIAFRNQLDFRELAAWNDIGPDYLIHPGQTLRLTPPPGGAPIRTTPIGPPPPTGSVGSAPAAPRPPTPAAPAEVVLKFAWRWPTAGSVLKPFSEGGKGVDIGGTLGQPVVAAAPGKVVYSGGALKGYGELIIIKHDDVHLSAYGYNRRRLVGEGATVAAGQPIAELGLGPEQKPVLHFEVRRRGKPVDPAGYLPKQ
ncbi:MAG: peptidoglycan DD-metalloendopeptidase family protein [Gammaproteobacteria bacterium]